MEKRRTDFNENERPKVHGKISRRLENLLARAYMREDLEGPLEGLEDIELLRIRNFGKGLLQEFRKVIEGPKEG